MKDSQYFPFIDHIKGIAILLVVVGHAIAWTQDDFVYIIQERPKIEMFWWHFIYSFHMPLFFWVSGYLYSRGEMTIDKIPIFLWKKTYTLIFPFVFSGALLFLVGGAIIGS